MKPTHKFNSGNKATLCKSCRCIITEGFTNELLCTECQEKAIELLILTQDGNFLPDELSIDVYKFIEHLYDEES